MSDEFLRTPTLLVANSGWVIARDATLQNATEYLMKLDPICWSPHQNDALSTKDHSEALEWLDSVA